MYEPVHVRRSMRGKRGRRARRRRRWMMVVLVVASLTALVVTVVKALPDRPPAERLTLNDLAMLMPDRAHTELIAAMVRAQIAKAKASPRPPATASGPCLAPSTPHSWDSAQRENATTIVEVGLALGISQRGLIVALATAMQESRLYNLGHQGANNDHDSLGLFQQRPSMGWGSKAQVTDPIYAATAFYLALQRVTGWESMRVTAAAQRVQRSAFPNAYAQWESDATSLTQAILCNETAGPLAPVT
jgi:hypothetical protein